MITLSLIILFVALWAYRVKSFNEAVESAVSMPGGYVLENLLTLRKHYFFDGNVNLAKASMPIALVPKAALDRLVSKYKAMVLLLPTMLIMILVMFAPTGLNEKDMVGFVSFYIGLTIMAGMGNLLFYTPNVDSEVNELTEKILNAASEKITPLIEREALEYQIDELNKEIESSGIMPRRLK